MRLSLPLAFCAAMWAAAAQAEIAAQVTAPVTISPLAPAPRAPAVMKNSIPAATVAEERNVPSAGASPTEETPQAGAPHRRKGLRVRFEEANTTHDGRLTPEQAQASWPSIAKHFSEIDRDHRGYVTVDDIRLYRREHRRQNGMPDQGTPGAGRSIGGKAGASAPDTEQ